MKSILLILAMLIATAAAAHEDATANHDGGPCWVWELPETPIYCIFTKGARHEHPQKKGPD
jgi:hypothetical protein